MLTTRILPPEEWASLDGTEAGPVWRHLAPENASVIVVESGSGVVGCLVMMRVVHAECLWIDPTHRANPVIGRQLIRGMHRQARAWGAKVIASHPVADHIKTLIFRLGGRLLPGETTVMEVKGEPTCHK